MITTEMLEAAGCIIDGLWAYDVYGKSCVAWRSSNATEWVRWKNYKGEIPRATFRIKAKHKETE